MKDFNLPDEMWPLTGMKYVLIHSAVLTNFFLRSFEMMRKRSILMVLMDLAINGGIFVRNRKHSVIPTSVTDLSWYGALSLLTMP